jgi:Ice-binding-like
MMTAKQIMTVILVFGLGSQSKAQFLGTADSFAVLAGSTVTNTGLSLISGDLGVWPGSAVTGFPPGIITGGALHAGDASAMQAQADVTIAYTNLEGEAFTQDLTGKDLGGMTLGPGVYHFDDSAFLTGTLILDAGGDPNARFDFQIGSTLITASSASVVSAGGADSCNVYWQVGSSATLGTNTSFSGHILALTSITMNTGASILEGSALARNGAVTLDSNTITACTTLPALLPEPGTLPLFALGLLIHRSWVVRRRRRRSLYTGV